MGGTLESRGSWRLAGPALAAGVAAAAAAPGLGFPFLGEDWILVEEAGGSLPPLAPFGYLRPLYSATFWIDRRVWGASPALLHLTNLLLLAACAALLVLLVRRVTGDGRLAALAGLLFAAHPYHVECAAMLAGRTDPLVTALMLAAAIRYDRWRVHARAMPLAAMLLFETALLAKESAIVLPAVLILIACADRSRRPGRGEWARGFLPMLLLGAVHVLLVRPAALGAGPRSLVQGNVGDWIERGAGYSVAALIPVDVELIASSPWLWGGLAAGAMSLLVILARLGAGALPRLLPAAAAAFVLLLLPAFIGFQERYLFPATAALAVIVGALLHALGGRRALAGTGLILLAWTGAGIAQWGNWREAARASERLVRDLAAASRREGIREIVVANMPFRVRGGSVFVHEQFLPALRLAGGRPIPVHAACYVALPSAGADALEGGFERAVRRSELGVEVALRIVPGPFSHYSGPGEPGRSETFTTERARVTLDGMGRVSIEILRRRDGRRAAYVWREGSLVELF